jgi:hypothetical protein
MYKITEQVVKLQEFLSNSVVQKYIYNRLRKHGLIQQYFSFLILSSMYALRNEPTKMFDSLKIFPVFKEVIKEENSWKDFLNMILSSDETQMKAIADEIASYMAENSVLQIYSLSVLNNKQDVSELDQT